jgi:microcystin-dependent protein
MKTTTLVTALACALAWAGDAASQTSDRYIGDIFIFGGNFCPRGSVEANGALYPINQYQAVFSLLGTYYGGDGRSTFGVPNFRGRVPVSAGQGPALPNWNLGAQAGSETVQMPHVPSHSHSVYGTTGNHSQPTPQGNALATFDDGQTPWATSNVDVPMASGMVTTEGQSQPFTNMAPTQAIRYCVVFDGQFPPRS